MEARTASILSAALRLAQTRLAEFQTLPHLQDIRPTDAEIDRLCEWLAAQVEFAKQRELILSARLERMTDEA